MNHLSSLRREVGFSGLAAYGLKLLALFFIDPNRALELKPTKGLLMNMIQRFPWVKVVIAGALVLIAFAMLIAAYGAANVIIVVVFMVYGLMALAFR